MSTESSSQRPSSRRPRATLMLCGTTLLGVLFAAAASARVTLFDHSGFRGRSSTIYDAAYNLKGSRVGNDRASSVIVEPGCTAVLYRDSNFRGPAIEVRGEVENLRYTALGNDRVSSVDVVCGRGRRSRDQVHRHGPGCGHDGYGDSGYDRRYRGAGYDDRYDQRRGHGRSVGLHKDDHFSGRTIWVSGSIPHLGRTQLGNDRLTSVTVPRGCRVTLYEDSHFRGRAMTVYQDIPNLHRTRVGNDRVSSVDVDCR